MWFPSLGGSGAGGGASGAMTIMPSEVTTSVGATGVAQSRVRPVLNGQMGAQASRARTQHASRPSQSAIRTGAGFIRLKTSKTGS